MEITPSNLIAFFHNANIRFQDAYASAPAPWSDQIATLIPSESESEEYGWSGFVDQLREWIGDREVADLSAYSQIVKNRDFERTISISKPKFEDGKFGLFNHALTALAWSAKKWPDTLILPRLLNGQSTLCYDGQNFFDTAHPIDKYKSGSATQSNYFTSRALTYDNYIYVRTQMMSLLNESGLPYGVMPDTLIVSPANEGIGKQIIEASFVAPQTVNGVTQVGSNENIYKGSAKLIVIPELQSDPGGWYLADLSRPIRPFVFQQRKAPVFVYQTDPSSPEVFRTNKFVYGVDSRGEGVSGIWWLCAKAHS